MNPILECIRTRRSVKSYKPEMPPMEAIEAICKAGTYAPTGMGSQSPIIIAVTNKAMRDRLSRINLQIVMGNNLTTSSGHSDPFYGAPVVLVVLAAKGSATRLYDGSLVMQNMMLAAHSLGLGSCWIHRAKETFETEEGKNILLELGIEGEYEGIGNCIVGYQDQPTKEQKPRKDNYIVWVRDDAAAVNTPSEDSLLQRLFATFKEKGYTAEDFYGGCALCGDANEFALDIIDSGVTSAYPEEPKFNRDRLTSKLYSQLHSLFEKEEER